MNFAAHRENLGKLVRAVWIAWAKEQPDPKPSWLVPWEGLNEPDKEVDRLIGERLAQEGVDLAMQMAGEALDRLDDALKRAGEKP